MATFIGSGVPQSQAVDAQLQVAAIGRHRASVVAERLVGQQSAAAASIAAPQPVFLAPTLNYRGRATSTRRLNNGAELSIIFSLLFLFFSCSLFVYIYYSIFPINFSPPFYC